MAGRNGQLFPRPPIAVSSSNEEVRFANTHDGWVIGTSGTTPFRALWATHDGGLQWEQSQLPGGVLNSSAADIEAATGVVYGTLCGIPIHIGMSPVNVEDWTISTITLSVGAGPVCDEQIVLQGKVGWLVNVDRVVIGGARLVNGAWVPWRPPCTGSLRGPAELAASDPVHVVMACETGVYSGPAGVRVYFSGNGGSTFQSDPRSLPQRSYGPIASPAPGVVIMGSNSQGDLMGTFDGGKTWTTLYRPPAPGGCRYVGFTTSTQGVAVEEGGTLLMTFDGGREWAPVAVPPTQR